MERVIHFEIQADDPERAVKFYTSVFDWKIERWGNEKYWLIMTDPSITMQTMDKPSQEPGINGGLLPRPAKAAPKECGANAFVCTVSVKDFDATAKKIEAAGGTVAMPKMAIAGMAWQGYFHDLEGNVFGVHQIDKNAK